jgi:hypothetical protein
MKLPDWLPGYKIAKLISRQLLVFLVTAILAAIGASISWQYVTICALYSLGNNVSKLLPIIEKYLTILAKKFNIDLDN